MENYIPVVFATDDGYAFPTGVAIASLLKNKKKDTKYKIYLITPELSEDNLCKLRSFNDKTCQIEIIYAKDLLNGMKATLEKVTNTDYYRLMLDTILLKEDKVIALDGDLIVLDDLTDLYNIDLEENYIGGCYFRPHDIYNRAYVQNVLTLDEGKRINIGVMLMNLKKLRQDGIQEKFLSKIGQFDVMSEDIINYVCKDRIKYIPVKYNYNLHFYKYKDLLKGCPVYSDNEYLRAERNPAIFHYTLEKPWKVDVVYRQRAFEFYKNKSPYKRTKLRIKKKNLVMKKVFSIENISVNDRIYKQINLLGIRIKIKKKKI